MTSTLSFSARNPGILVPRQRPSPAALRYLRFSAEVYAITVGLGNEGSRQCREPSGMFSVEESSSGVSRNNVLRSLC
jgi:hypothetical protein